MRQMLLILFFFSVVFVMSGCVNPIASHPWKPDQQITRIYVFHNPASMIPEMEPILYNLFIEKGIQLVDAPKSYILKSDEYGLRYSSTKENSYTYYRDGYSGQGYGSSYVHIRSVDLWLYKGMKIIGEVHYNTFPRLLTFLKSTNQPRLLLPRMVNELMSYYIQNSFQNSP